MKHYGTIMVKLAHNQNFLTAMPLGSALCPQFADQYYLELPPLELAQNVGGYLAGGRFSRFRLR